MDAYEIPKYDTMILSNTVNVSWANERTLAALTVNFIINRPAMPCHSFFMSLLLEIERERKALLRCATCFIQLATLSERAMLISTVDNTSGIAPVSMNT